MPDSSDARSSNEHLVFIAMVFEDACHREADPASIAYYLNVLAEGRMTYEQVRQAIALSCQPRNEHPY